MRKNEDEFGKTAVVEMDVVMVALLLSSPLSLPFFALFLSFFLSRSLPCDLSPSLTAI